jgi:hypothetical protein
MDFDSYVTNIGRNRHSKGFDAFHDAIDSAVVQLVQTLHVDYAETFRDMTEDEYQAAAFAAFKRLPEFEARLSKAEAKMQAAQPLPTEGGIDG